MRGEFDRAREIYGAAGVVYEELGLRLPRVGWTEIVAAVELLAGDVAGAILALRSGYEVLDAGGLDGQRTYHAALLAFVLASQGETAAAQRFAQILETFDGPLDRETEARLRAAQAQLAGTPGDAARLAREAVDAADSTDNLNLRADMRLVLARVSGDAAEAAAARELFETKENVAGMATTGLWSLQS